MIYLLTAIHVIVRLVLTVIVLLQSGKAADLAGAFGGMGSQTAFGPRGSTTVLSKATAWAAVTLHGHFARLDNCRQPNGGGDLEQRS